MTYQSLYRKYRSQTFSDLVGQAAVIRALEGAITSARVSHAYLFSGTRGTGKTSTARLLAKAVNCTARADEDPEPCNSCPSCLAVQAGTALDLIEIDAASNRGIDEIRDLRNKVNLAPAQPGGKKVYILDEAHMLSTDAFNALLKTLEEPPEHAVFILCTTDPSKIPATVIGRCQQFQFRRFTDEQIMGRLRHIAEREQVTVEDGALRIIAGVAQGTMRDAVGLLDQLIPLADGPITEGLAREMLGMTDPARLDELLDLVLRGDAGGALGGLENLYAAGAELRQVVRGVMERCRDRLVAAIGQRDAALRHRLAAILDGLLHLDGEIRRHAEPRFLAEATFVRLAVEVGEAGEMAAAATAPAQAPAPARTSSPRLESEATPAPTLPPPAASQPAPAARSDPASGPGSGPIPPPVTPDGNLEAGWSRILDALPAKIKAYYREARPEREGTTFRLWFPYTFHHKAALESQAEVEPRIQAWLGSGTTVEIRLKEERRVPGGTPTARRPAVPEDDPAVQQAMRKLEGRVVRVTGRPDR